MTKILLCLLLLVLSPLSASAQSASAQDTAGEAGVKEMFQSYVLAFNAGDLNSLTSIWCEDGFAAVGGGGGWCAGRLPADAHTPRVVLV